MTPRKFCDRVTINFHTCGTRQNKYSVPSHPLHHPTWATSRTSPPGNEELSFTPALAAIRSLAVPLPIKLAVERLPLPAFSNNFRRRAWSMSRNALAAHPKLAAPLEQGRRGWSSKTTAGYALLKSHQSEQS